MSIGHGDSQVSYGGSEQPRYAALRHSIDGYYADLLRPLAVLRAAVYSAIGATDPATKTAEPFRYTTASRQVIDRAVEQFLTVMAGPDRTRKGFVQGGSESPDGVIQSRDVLAYAIGLHRGADLAGKAQTMQAGRDSPAVREMLDNAFDRLSAKGALRLEQVRDDIHGALTSAQSAGLNPIETARQLAAQFDQYKGWEFQRLARTESAFAAGAGARDQMQDLGVQRVEVMISASACEICQGYEGQVFDVGDTDNQPPYHPNCLCDTAPAAPGA